MNNVLIAGPIHEAGRALLELEQVILTPHCASHAEECMARMSTVSVQNLLDAIDGELDPDLVANREVLGR